jgi:hypothetical protein
MQKVLVCRTAWMDFYQGLKAGRDKPQGGGAFVEENGFGHEVFNFLKDDDGCYRGYVRPPTAGHVEVQTLNIDRLGAKPGSNAVHGITVFWVATDPRRGGTRVVGWYEDATVLRRWSPSPRKRTLPDGKDAGFMIQAKSAHLVASDDRDLVIPRASATTEGIGQANLWYPPEHWVERLLTYKRTGTNGEKPRPGRKPPRMQDTERRLEIERIAVRTVISWCEDRGLGYEDVSLKRLGWDIQAGEGSGLLRIEVKGTSAPITEAVAELTPNEFAKMFEHRDSFRVAVVSVHGRAPVLAMFSWSRERDCWMDSSGQFELAIRKIESAVVSVRS